MENNSTDTLDQIENFLRPLIESLEKPAPRAPGRGRPRILPAMCLWSGVIIAVLRGWSSQLAIWRLLARQGLWDYPRFPLTDQAIYKRLSQSGAGDMKQLFDLVSQALGTRLEPYVQTHLAPFAAEVVALDQTTLDPVLRHLPALRPFKPGDRKLLPGKLAAAYDLRRQQWRWVEYLEDPEQNEKVVARQMLAHLPVGSLILADLGYFSFAWFDDLTDQDYFWVSRLRRKTSYRVVHVYYQDQDTFDGLIWLGVYRADRAAHAVRLVRFKVGQQTYQYITNVTDPHQLSLAEIAGLYARRWDIEMAFKLIKRELNLHLLWSGKPEVILIQVWAVLLISQILHALQLEIAGRAGVDPFDVSLPLLVEYLSMVKDRDLIAFWVEEGRAAGFIRPSRRIRIQTPPMRLGEYVFPPPDLVHTRIPRHAGKI